MDNNSYKNLLQESYIIDTFSIRHDSLLMELDLLNLAPDDIKRKINKVLPTIEKTLKKYKINVNDIKKLAKQTGSKFVNDLKLDKIKNKEKQKEKVMDIAKKIISKKFNIDKIKAAVDLDNKESNFNKQSYVIKLILNFMIASYLSYVLFMGMGTPLTAFILAWNVVEVFRTSIFLIQY